MAAKAAPSALVVATRAADGGCTPGHVPAPQCPTGTEDGQDKGESARRTTRLRSVRCSPPGGWCPALCDGRRGGRWGGTSRRPAPLLEVLPQEQVQQRTVEQIVDPVPLVPLLCEVVPQMLEQLVDFLSPLDFPVPEQVIEVPKIVCPLRAARTVICAPQTAEQLVEAPTIVSLVEVIEQPVDIPVRAWSGTVDVFKVFSWTVFLLVCGAERGHSSSSWL